MSTTAITLGSEVVVSDPCYSIPTWCQTILKGVLPGRYIAQVNEDPETSRVAQLILIHVDHLNRPLEFEEHSTCGVDSGQLGIFDASSYRDDAAVARMTVPDGEFLLSHSHRDEGDQWYEAMCKFTLFTPEQFGSYDTGVVTSSGYGDGIYPLEISRDSNDNIVAMQVTYIFEDDEEDEDEYED